MPLIAFYCHKTDGQIDNFFDTIYRYADFFCQLNLLPPYSLRSQGDNNKCLSCKYILICGNKIIEYIEMKETRKIVVPVVTTIKVTTIKVTSKAGNGPIIFS